MVLFTDFPCRDVLWKIAQQIYWIVTHRGGGVHVFYSGTSPYIINKTSLQGKAVINHRYVFNIWSYGPLHTGHPLHMVASLYSMVGDVIGRYIAIRDTADPRLIYQFNTIRNILSIFKRLEYIVRSKAAFSE